MGRVRTLRSRSLTYGQREEVEAEAAQPAHEPHGQPLPKVFGGVRVRVTVRVRVRGRGRVRARARVRLPLGLGLGLGSRRPAEA